MISMKQITASFLLCIVYLSAAAQKTNSHEYLSAMQAFNRAIHENFYDSVSGFYKESVTREKNKNAYSYLWPLCGMLQSANEIEKISAGKGMFINTMNVIQNYYDSAAPAPGYASYIMQFGGGDRFYDDNQWIGIASMDAYSRTKNKSFLKTG